jgi:2-polyprenyl-3-methyl-5-hydroxy-6-metoxy-1,4-benzoquinol methylase
MDDATKIEASDSQALREILYSAYVSAFKGDARTEARPLTKGQRSAFQRFVMPFLDGISRDAEILDLGCGDGGLLAYLGDQGFTHSRGVDCSTEQVALARARGVAADVGSLFDVLAQRPASYDVIFAIDVVEHMTKPELARLGRLLIEALRPGGRLVIQTPNGEGLCCGHVVYGDLTHETIFNESSITQFLRAFGFERVVVRETGPIPHSAFGAIRYFGWQAIRLAAQIASVVQTGRWPSVLTATLLAAAEKPRTNT